MSELNLKQKLIEIRKQVEFLQKDTQGYGYKYVSEDKVLFAIKDTMNELEVLLVPSVANHSVREFEYINAKNKVVKENIVSGDMIFTWVNAENNETLVVPFALYGQQQDASQAFGSGLTYCNRYFLLKFFQVATNENDPDKVVSAKKAKEAKSLDNLDGANITVEQKDIITNFVQEGKLDIQHILKFFNVNSVDELNFNQAKQVIIEGEK